MSGRWLGWRNAVVVSTVRELADGPVFKPGPVVIG
jgi:hypothetical protein